MSQRGRGAGADRGASESSNRDADRGLAQSLHANEGATEGNNNATNRGRSDRATLAEGPETFENTKKHLLKKFQDAVDKGEAFNRVYEVTKRYFTHLASSTKRTRNETIEKQLDTIQATLKRIKKASKGQQVIEGSKT